ncbi:HD-GYP domain-containing protein [Sporosarcina sp. FA9]|uniref:HD-GYP domain-containing protein n=1 Tax=Sporosarcina sp. FA9 TaxID=3413030 RepID=UPI003F654FF4
MEASYVKVSGLRPGFRISEDIFANTSNPIIRQNSELTAEHLEILDVFGVKKIKVHDLVVIKKEESLDSDDFASIDPDDILSKIPMNQIDTVTLYRDAVQKYKKEFSSWQAGIKPDVAKVRAIIIPLVDAFIGQKKLLPILNDLSNLKEYMYHHSIAVGILSSAISNQMELPLGQTIQVGISGALADCGMAKIDESIINKAAFLTSSEFNEVKKHTIYSYQMIQDTPLLRQEMKLAIIQHHERLDGSGYPRGEKREEISIYSQIVAVADVFHAMTSERVYREKVSPYKVIEMITEEEFGKFDIKVVQALHNLVGDLSIGTKVRLTNGDEGEVIFVHRDARLRPMVKLSNGSIMDLTVNRSIAVERVLSDTC